MLIVKDALSSGATRACYRHPNDPHKCVKILFNPKKIHLIYKQLKNNEKLQKHLAGFIPRCYGMIDTNLGKGLVAELVCNDDGQISPNFACWLKNNTLTSDIKAQFDAFFIRLLEQKLWFYDFNAGNFVIQHINGTDKVVFIDTKSYNHNNSWSMLKLEYIIPVLAHRRMKRRILRFYSKHNLEIPEKLKGL